MIILIFLLLTLVSAIVAVELRDLLSAAIVLGVSGFFVGVLFLLMMAPDLAMVQFLVETATTIVFVVAISRTHRRSSEPERFGSAIVLVVILASTFLAYSTFTKFITPFGSTQYTLARSVIGESVAGRYVDQSLSETGSRNFVCSVVFDYRGFDTLGEVTVLFVSVLGISAILRKKLGRGER
ncbi:MAG: hydrogen gas-evolving membrane-bound hydrogenase subunit E [Candidatus Hadarchaeales archaeon]